jgi:hypothetical protein
MFTILGYIQMRLGCENARKFCGQEYYSHKSSTGCTVVCLPCHITMMDDVEYDCLSQCLIFNHEACPSISEICEHEYVKSLLTLRSAF